MKKWLLPFLIILYGTCNLFPKSISDEDTNILQQINAFNRIFPQEKVYLHFDNSAYFLDDTMHFCAYVVQADNNRPVPLSRVLYVELLTPEGVVARTHKYKIGENGRCSGSFFLDSVYFAGYFEVRAYTRYMLNFAPDNYYTRVFPVYKKAEEGNYKFRTMDTRTFSMRDSVGEGPPFYFGERKAFFESDGTNLLSERELMHLCPPIDSTFIHIQADGYSKEVSPDDSVMFILHGPPNQTLSVSVTDGSLRYPTFSSSQNICNSLVVNNKWFFNTYGCLHRKQPFSLMERLEKGLLINGKAMKASDIHKIDYALAPYLLMYLKLYDIQGQEQGSTTFKSDSLGRWAVGLPDFEGMLRGKVASTDLSAYLNCHFQIDKWFSPPPRRYLYEECHPFNDPAFRWTISDGWNGLSLDINLKETVKKGKKSKLRWKYTPSLIPRIRFSVEELIEFGMDQFYTPDDDEITEKRRGRYSVGVLSFYIDLGAGQGNDFYCTNDYSDRKIPNGKRAEVNQIVYIIGSKNYKEVVTRNERELLEKCNFSNYSRRIKSYQFKQTNFRGISTYWPRSLKRESSNTNSENLSFPDFVDCWIPYGKDEVPMQNTKICSPVRYTVIHGFTPHVPFNDTSPIRRTLYWNPSLKTDDKGNAVVKLKNSSICHSLHLSVEGITEEGIPIIY